MKAAVCYEFGKPLVIEEVELIPPQKGEVKVRVATTAICHSDIHDVKGELPGQTPFIGGHEVAGDIHEVGGTFGATHSVNAGQDNAIEAVKKLTGGRGSDHVFVTVGSVAAIRQGFSMSGPRGMTVIIGLPPMKDLLSISPFEFIASERMLTGGFMGSANLQINIPLLITLYKAGRLKLDELITGRYPLEEINEAMESTAKGEAIRNVIMFP
jgi:Zn-dependent alcohol dehydrogenase